MIKQDFITRVAEECGTTKQAAEKWINAIFGIAGDVLSEGEDLFIMGFGKFLIKPTPERRVKIPNTDEFAVKPAGNRVKFSAAERIKRGLNHIGYVKF